MSNSNSNTSRIVVHMKSTRLALLQRDLYDCGFDIFVPFHPQWYNDCLDQDENFQHLLRLPSSTYDDSKCSDDKNHVVIMASEEAFLIGNTKHLWPFFKAWLREQQDDDVCQQQQQQQVPETLVASQENDASTPSSSCLSPSSLKSQHPLDSYCQECIERCVKKHFHQQKLQQQQQQHNDDISKDDDKDNAKCQEYTSSSYRIYWSCTFAPNQMVSMQHVSMVSGFAYFDPLTNLCVHPVYGTWHSYRAVVVVLQSIKNTPTRCIQENDSNNTSGNTNIHLIRAVPPPPPPRVPCLLSVAEQECARVALARAIHLCTSCSNTGNSTNISSSNSISSIKKSCFDMLLHGQDKKHNNVKQQDDGCTTDHDNDNKNTNSNNRSHDDDDDFLSICQAWIDLRDCVQTGKEEYRYDYDQLMYHFTKDKRYLLLD